MFDHIHTAINTRALAIPHPKDPIVPGTLEQIGLLAAPDRGRRQILINARLKMDIMLLQPGFCPPHGLVDAADRRAAIARDKCRGVKPTLLVALMLQHREAHQGFNAGHIRPGGIQSVLIIQRNLCGGA